MFINHSSKEVTAKIVYYGPGLSGKTTCLQYIFSVTNPNTRGELISIETEIERTLFFDLLPMNVGLVKGYQTKFQLYTVPGQVFYDSTRKLVLKGADGVVFVADSQKPMKQPNLDSLENLRKNLVSHKLEMKEIPMVFQYNKRDLNSIFSIEELNKFLNPWNLPFFGSIATNGKGVLEALRAISSLILGKIKHLLDQSPEDSAVVPAVDFATNKKHKIIDRDNLPYKKIQTESFEAISKRLNLKDAEMKFIDDVKEIEEELRVETVEEFDDFKDIMFQEEPLELEPYDMEAPPLYGTGVGETKNPPPQKTKDKNIPNIPEIDELDAENDELLGKTVVEPPVDVSEYRVMEEIVEKELQKEKEPEKPEKEFEIEIESEPFKGLQDIPLDQDIDIGSTKLELGDPLEEEIEELEDIGELVPEEGFKKTPEVKKEIDDSDETKDAEPFKLEEEENLDMNEPPFQDFENLKEGKIEVPFKDLEDVKKEEKKGAKPSHDARKVEALRISLEKQKKDITSKGMDLFEQLKDKTRLTVIRAVTTKGPDPYLLVDIKDKDSNLLDSVKIKVTPEIKKVTLILDVKK